MSVQIVDDEHTIVRASGEIDLSNVSDFHTVLTQATEIAPKGFIIDLTDASYIDSAGVQAILSAYRKMKESEGCLIVVVGNEQIKSVLEVVHLEFLPGVCIFEDLESAKKVLRAREAG